MKLHHGIFQQVFHIAAENTGQTIEGFRTGLVEGFPSLLIHLNGANEALRVEFSTFLKLYVGLRANQGNWSLGKFVTSSMRKSSFFDYF